jgi:hypothetical protein
VWVWWWVCGGEEKVLGDAGTWMSTDAVSGDVMLAGIFGRAEIISFAWTMCMRAGG